MNKNPIFTKYEVGDWSYGNPDIIKIGSYQGTLKIGRFCSFASGVKILLVNDHRYDWISTFPFSVLFNEAKKHSGYPKRRGDLNIGNDVWVGYGAVILSGVTIGNGSVIGANTMVTKDVPSYATVAGNPGKVIKYRFSEEIIHKLEEIAWWDWPIEKIKENFNLLLSTNFEELIRKYGK